ncbi:chaplin family protein [Nostoc sp.]|uniref:chaplin family protein n=1 Tax=Nostoc sp. TaxID=1180 RepID=UPI002FFAC030
MINNKIADLETSLFEELDDADLLTIVGGAYVQASASGILSGNLDAPIQIPISICGSAVAILGNASAGCEGGSTPVYLGSSIR